MIKYLACVKQVAHILQEGLHFDLCVGEQEDAMRLGGRGLAHYDLEVVPPLGCAVALGDLYLEELRLSHVCGQAREGLTPAASHAHQERVSARLLDDPRDAAHMLDGEAEQHQIHGRLAHIVVLLEVALDHLPQPLQVGHLPVAAVLTLGVVEVAEHEAAQIVLCHTAVVVLVQVLEELVEVLLQVAVTHLLQEFNHPRLV